jgi:MATE family multidrug resistance protein
MFSTMLYRPGYRAMARLAAPTVLSRLGVMAMGLTDAVIVGRWSATELGYHSLGWAPTMTVLVAALGLLVGVQVLTARHLGEGRPELTGAVLRRGLSYAAWIGVGSTAMLLAAGPWLLHSIGLSQALAAGASAALRIFALSLTPYLLADCFWLWLEAHGKSRVPMVAMWLANVLNLVLGVWIVPGHSPFPVSGAVGAAWVTLVARSALLLMLAAYVLTWPAARRFGLFAPRIHDRSRAAEQRRIGYASGLSYAIEAGSFAALSLVAGRLGALAVAEWTIVMNVASILFMVPLGIGAATAVLVAAAHGAGDDGGIRHGFVMGQRLSAATLALATAVILLAHGPIAALYTRDPQVAAAGGAGLMWSTLFFMADGAQVVAGNALRARGDIWWPTGMHAFSYAVLMLPLAAWLALGQGQGVNGIVWAITLASFVSAAALVLRFFRLARHQPRLPEPLFGCE